MPGTVKVWLTWVLASSARTVWTGSGMFGMVGIMCCTWMVPPTVPQTCARLHGCFLACASSR